MDHVHMEVMEGEGEMQKINAALRSVAAGGDETFNCLRLSAAKGTELPKLAMPRFKLQLSSPIEELELTKIWDPLNADAKGSASLPTVTAADASFEKAGYKKYLLRRTVPSWTMSIWRSWRGRGRCRRSMQL